MTTNSRNRGNRAKFHSERPSTGLFPLDPVCGKPVTDDGAWPEHNFIGQSYGFCSTECRNRFARMPEKYVTLLAYGRDHFSGHR